MQITIETDDKEIWQRLSK